MNSTPPPITERVVAESLCLKVEEAGDILWARVQGYPWWPAQRMPLDAAHQHPALGNAARKKGQDTPVMFFGAAEVAWVTTTEQQGWRAGIQKRFHLNTRLHKRFAEALLQLVHLLELQYTPPGWFRHTGVVAPPPAAIPKPKRPPPNNLAAPGTLLPIAFLHMLGFWAAHGATLRFTQPPSATQQPSAPQCSLRPTST